MYVDYTLNEMIQSDWVIFNILLFFLFKSVICVRWPVVVVSILKKMGVPRAVESTLFRQYNVYIYIWRT